MENREIALQEIYNRIKANREFLGVKTFKRNPTQPVIEKDLPTVFLTTENDVIHKRDSRGRSGYPATRVLEIVVELVAGTEIDLMSLFRDLRRVVFSKVGSDMENFHIDMIEPNLYENTFINENRTEGPIGYGLPDVLGIRLVLDLVYSDNGF
jgi:hypothetical protein